MKTDIRDTPARRDYQSIHRAYDIVFAQRETDRKAQNKAIYKFLASDDSLNRLEHELSSARRAWMDESIALSEAEAGKKHQNKSA